MFETEALSESEYFNIKSILEKGSVARAPGISKKQFIEMLRSRGSTETGLLKHLKFVGGKMPKMY
jgi:hypothetical protein